MSALRLARGITGRDKIDQVRRLLSRPRRRAAGRGRVRASPRWPSPARRASPRRRPPTRSCCRTTTGPRSRETFATYGDEIAAVITEAAPRQHGRRRRRASRTARLQRRSCAEICHAHGALFITDEVMTGFRVTRSGQYGLDGVRRRPDDLRQGDGRRLPGGGVRRPGRADGPPGRRSAPSTRPARCRATRSPRAAGLTTLRLATTRSTRQLDTTVRGASRRGLRGAGRGRRTARRVQTPGTCSASSSSIRRGRRPELRRRLDAVDARRYAAFFHAMLDAGVYLPPSAYEAWFVSAAHDDAALDRIVSALPGGRRSGRGRRGVASDVPSRPTWRTPTTLIGRSSTWSGTVEVDNPHGRALRPAARLPPVRHSAGRWPTASPSAPRGRDVTHLRCSPARAGPGDRSNPSRDVSRSPVTIDGRADRGQQPSRGHAGFAWVTARCGTRRTGGCSATRSRPTWGEPYAEIVARMRLALRDAARRRPRATRRSSCLTSCRSGWCAATPRAAGSAHDPRKRECALASVTSLHLRRRPASPSIELLRAPAADLMPPGRQSKNSRRAPDGLTAAPETSPAAATPSPARPGRRRRADGSGPARSVLRGVASTGAARGDADRGGLPSVLGRAGTAYPPAQRKTSRGLRRRGARGRAALRRPRTAARSWCSNVWGSWCSPVGRRRRRSRRPAQDRGRGGRSSAIDTQGQRPAPRRSRSSGRIGHHLPEHLRPERPDPARLAGDLPPSAIPSTLVLDKQGRVAAGRSARSRDATLADMVDDVAGRASDRRRRTGPPRFGAWMQPRSADRWRSRIPVAVLAGLVSLLLPVRSAAGAGLSVVRHRAAEPAEVVEGNPAGPPDARRRRRVRARLRRRLRDRRRVVGAAGERAARATDDHRPGARRA